MCGLYYKGTNFEYRLNPNDVNMCYLNLRDSNLYYPQYIDTLIQNFYAECYTEGVNNNPEVFKYSYRFRDDAIIYKFSFYENFNCIAYVKL